MNWNYLNTILLSIICFLTISLLLIDISVNISWSASITDWLSVIIYACTLGAAIWAGITAKHALKENKRMADDNQILVKSQTEPFVDISLETMPQELGFVRLKIQNLGLSSAFNIKFYIKDYDLQKEPSKKIIDTFTEILFMREGLNYLSKGSTRYTGIVNLYVDNVTKRGFSNEDFFATEFSILIAYEDINKKTYERIFNLKMNELSGDYKIGDAFEKKVVDSINSISKSLDLMCAQHKEFKEEYEKLNRNWTEQELQLKLCSLKKQREIRDKLGLPPEPIRKMARKESIHQVRKQAK